ncbi:MAG TPA: MMPL family transporter [Propionibacteriaceae bacterium]|nr:MMPL family transporter [Propionibacteriaceae bacterium]
MHAIARILTSRLWSAVIALVAVLGSGLVIGLVGAATHDAQPTDGYPIGSDSRAAVQLAQSLPGTDSLAAVVVFSRTSALTPADLSYAAGRLSAVKTVPGVTVVSPVVPAKDGTAAVATLNVAGTSAVAARDAVSGIRTVLADGRPDGLSAQVTGPAGITADLAKVFDGANFRLLGTTALVVAILLIVTYRSPVLWLIPLTIVGLADQVAGSAATHILTALGMTFDQSTTGILSVLVFGAGTDYALLLISRYRDELRRTDDRRQAMARAWRRTVETVTSSAVTVFVGLLSIVLSLFPSTRGLGLACAIGVVVAATFVMVALPAALVCFGRWVFWPRIPRSGELGMMEKRTLWRRVGDAVAKRPAVYAAATLVVLIACALPVMGLKTGLTQSEQFIRTPEAIVAADRVAQSFSAGSVDPARVYTTGDVAAVTSALSKVAAVESVRPGASGGGVSELVVTLRTAPSSPEAQQAVRDLRTAVAGIPETHVGGTEARSLDTADAAARDRGLILPLILVLVLVALVVLLRSLVAPIVLVGTVLVTYVSSLGLSWLLFTKVIGFQRLDDATPLLAFVFLVALGVDYNIFLVGRAVEEAREHGTREAMIRSLAATGGVITSAGILLAAVFAVLGVLPLVALAQIGVIICVGVLLDTLVVRTVLVPALALLLGNAFWWPRRIGHPQQGEETARRAADAGPDAARAWEGLPQNEVRR